MPEGLSEREKWEWIEAQIRLHGLPTRGRPRKGQHKFTWADLGLTRQEVHLFRKLAEIPEEPFEAFSKVQSQRGRGRVSRRAILVHFGKINVIGDDVFDETDIGHLADCMLRWAGPALESLTARQLGYLARSLSHKLRSMATLKDLHDDGRVRGNDLRPRETEGNMQHDGRLSSMRWTLLRDGRGRRRSASVDEMSQ